MSPLRYFTLFPNTRINEFIRLENNLTQKFGEMEIVQSKSANEQGNVEQLETKLSDVNEQNGNLPDDTITLSETHRHLKWRKWATIAVDALLSFAAIKLFFLETINLDIPPIPATLLGILTAYFLLKLAISFKHFDGAGNEDNHSIVNRWKKYSYIIPILLIPFLSLYLILDIPNNPSNIIWVFFLVISFLLNLKVTAYSSQYIKMNLIERKKKIQEQLRARIKTSNVKMDKFQEKLSEIAAVIRRDATNFRRAYQSFPENERPELSLHIPYRFVLNTRVYFYDVLPIPPIVISNPPLNSGINRFCEQWDEATGTSVSINPQNILKPNEQESEISQDNIKEEQDSKNQEPSVAPVDTWNDNETFGKNVSDNEKFV